MTIPATEGLPEVVGIVIKINTYEKNLYKIYGPTGSRGFM